MSIPEQFLILDTRSKDHFKVQTYSNYLKKDVISIFQKKILQGEIEEACYWAVELILSLAIENMIDKMIMIAFKYINISSPKLPQLFWSNIDLFMDNIKKPEELRNYQPFRNHIIEICVILCRSSKGKPLSLDSQTKNKLDVDNITNHLEATINYLNGIRRSDDPEDLSIFMNELAHSMKSKNYDKAIMWLTYIFNFEKIVKKNKAKLVASKRNHSKDGNHIIWYVWELILTLSKMSLSNPCFNQVKYLFYIQKKRGYKSSELFLLVCAIKFNTHIYDMNANLYSPFSIQASARVNFLFEEGKKYENYKVDITKQISKNIEFKKEKKKKPKPEKKKQEEKTSKKLKQMELIDTIIQKKSSSTTRTIKNLMDIEKSFH